MPPPIYINTLVVCIRKRGKFGLDRPSAAAELMCYIQAGHFDFIFILGYSTGKLKMRYNIQRACCWPHTAHVSTHFILLSYKESRSQSPTRVSDLAWHQITQT